MPIIAVDCMPDGVGEMKTPIRVYFDGEYITNTFGRDYSGKYSLSILESLERARTYFYHIMENERSFIPKADYIIAFVRGKEDGTGLFHLVCYKNAGDRPGNPKKSDCVFEDGIFRGKPDSNGFGDESLVIGIEEAYRLGRGYLREYIENPPDLMKQEHAMRFLGISSAADF